MNIAPNKKHMEDLLSRIVEGKVVLFIGAGASTVSGAPNAASLSKMIKEKFPKIDKPLTNILDICQDVIDTPPYTRNDLEEYVRSVLLSIKPSRAHETLTQFDWLAIFTTNYDDLIEQAYRYESRLKDLNVVFTDDFPLTIGDRSKINLFKLMGSMTATEESTGTMVLTRDDHNNSFARRKKYLDLLFDFVKDGTILFIGYSFKDRIALNIMAQVIKEKGYDRVSYSYAIFPDLELTEKTRYMLNSRKIIPIKNDFETFVNYVDKKIPSKERPEKKIRELMINVRDKSIRITDDEEKQFLNDFDILTEANIQEDEGSKEDFFKGLNMSWGAFRGNWDFQRDIYIKSGYARRDSEGKKFVGSLKERVYVELEKYASDDNRILYITGMPGCGKSILLRRLAYDVYSGGTAPVILMNPDRVRIDVKALSSFIRFINRKFDELLPPGTSSPPVKPLIIFDNAAPNLRDIIIIKNILTSRGRPALIVAADRENELMMMSHSFGLNLPSQNVYRIHEDLNKNEKRRIVEHLYDLEFLESPGFEWDYIISDQYKESFFATVYSLVDPSKKPLNEIIRDQYMKLPPETQRAFRYVCGFHQYGYSMPLELLVRALKCGYEVFWDKIIGRDSRGVIYFEEDRKENMLFRAHHRIIAQKTVEFFFGDPEEQKECLSEILINANLNNLKEREIIEKILIFRIGPNIKPRRMTNSQLREIFTIVCSRYPIRSLLHHWGILEMEDGKFDEAEKLFKRALISRGIFLESYRGESAQNILTSLASLYSKMALVAQRSDKDKEARELFAKAEIQFRRAKVGDFPNAYAYHAQAYMNFERAKLSKIIAEKVSYLSEALKTILNSYDNVNIDPVDFPLIQQLEIEINAYLEDMDELHEEGNVFKKISKLSQKYPGSDVYYLYARILTEKRRFGLAMGILEKGLKKFPTDEKCLTLKAQLMSGFRHKDLEEYYNTLRKWKAIATERNLRLLFELGRTSFILGYYDYSREIFLELEESSAGHKLRSRQIRPIRDASGKLEDFEGIVEDLQSLYVGYIKCLSLRNLTYSIPFRPATCDFTPARGDLVKFSIAFSYRYPVAIRVRKK